MVNFAVTSEHRLEIKDSEKLAKYIYLARELKILWNM